MTTPYAQNTSVSVARTKAEIEDLVTRHGATGFGVMSQENVAMVMFTISGTDDMKLVIRMRLNLPTKEAYAEHVSRGCTRTSSPERQLKDWEQGCRSLWRSMLLVVKAKLEAVRAGISTIEREFLADIVTPTGMTVGEMAIPQLPAMVKDDRAPQLMLMGGRA